MILNPYNLGLLPTFAVRESSTFETPEQKCDLALLIDTDHAIRYYVKLRQSLALYKSPDVDCFFERHLVYRKLSNLSCLLIVRQRHRSSRRIKEKEGISLKQDKSNHASISMHFLYKQRRLAEELESKFTASGQRRYPLMTKHNSLRSSPFAELGRNRGEHHSILCLRDEQT